MYAHLTAHSAYSLQEGLIPPADLVQAAQSNGMSAIGLTDHNLLTGAIEFVTACKKNGIQPVIGLEIDLDSGPLNLLATSLEGWSNLCRLSSALALRDDPEAPCSLDLLSSFSKDMIALSNEPKALKEIFSDRLYVSLRDPSSAASLSKLASTLALPTVVTHPIYFLRPEQVTLQRTLTAIHLNKTISTIPSNAVAPSNAYFMSSHEMETRFKEYPEALAATKEIAERCKFDLPIGVPQMPTVPLPAGVTATQHLRTKATQGAKHLYGEITPVIQARLAHELEVIARMGFEPIFLIVEDILNFARQTGVPFSSRGSAASSLVAHCLGITSPDPLRLNLYFERFLNPARTTPPDIDTDLCSRRRDEVIRFVYQRYGVERVAMVSTVNRFRRRSALRETAKASGLSPAEIKTLIDKLPYRWWGPRALAASDENPYAELAGRYPAGRYQTIFSQAAALIGIPRHLSIHPAGVVIAPGALTDLVPIQMAAKGGVITQFDLESIARLGLVKIDLLGIRGLTVLGDVAEVIQARDPNRYTASLDALESIPEDDVATANLVQAGKTIGCFQIESPGMRATLKEIQARSVDDIMVALALYRPGPLMGGLKEAFVRRHRREEQAGYLHPALKHLLADMYGVILYQEQVLRIAHEMAGLSLADADLLRRAMSHFDPGEQMRTLKEKFVTGALAHSGVPQAVGERIWQLMAAFAGYGFPKAHAASYAQVAWRAAWCKTHEPAVFIAAVLANWGGYYGQRVYLMEARRMGLAVRAPHINHAGREFSVRYLEGRPVLFMGLDQVRDLTRRAQVRILNQRPFHSLADFLARVDPRPAEAENLIQSGALEGFGTIPTLLGQLKRGWRGGQLPLFELDATRGIE